MRPLGIAAILFFTLVAQPKVFACESYDLSQDRRFPAIRDQGLTPWCAAYAAADLLSYAEGYPVSAVDLAVSGNEVEHNDIPAARGREPNLLQSVQLGAIVVHARSNGLCPESRVPSSSEIGHSGRDLFVAANSNSPDAAILRRQYSPRRPPSGPIGGRSRSRSVVEFLNRVCGPRRVMRSQVHDSVTPYDDPQLAVRHLRDAVERKWPAVVGIRTARILGIPENGPHGLHALVVVGREWDSASQQCRYIVRNSWGVTCPPTLARNVSCQNGMLRIPEPLLHQNISGALTLRSVRGQSQMQLPNSAPAER